MRHIDLFSGIAGFALAARNVWGEDYENVGHCEIEKYPCAVYHKHFPESPCLGNISEIRWHHGQADIITGGFPCQPFSCAGKRRGKEDDRALWPEMFRAIREVSPRWIIGENVFGFVGMELDATISDLGSIGYSTEAFVIPACAVGAPHRRDRVWIVSRNFNCTDEQLGALKKMAKREKSKSAGICCDDANFEGARLPGRLARQGQKQSGGTNTRTKSWWAVEPNVGRVVYGLPNRVDRIKALGNAIVPQVAEEIMRGIKMVEEADDEN